MLLKNKIRLFLAILLPTTLVVAQRDSIVLHSNLRFHSTFEENVFNRFVQFQTDTLDAFLTMNGSQTEETILTLRKKFDALYQKLEPEKLAKNKTTVLIQKVYKVVKNQCMKKYSQDAVFSSILESGQYNEWTTSALLALIFDRFQIPTILMDSPTNLYILVDGGSKVLKLEAGNPEPITLEYSSVFKKQFVDWLIITEKCSDIELKTRNIDEIFEEKFNKINQISFGELLGKLYYFQALKKQPLEPTLDFAQKACFLYPSTLAQIRLYWCLAKRLNNAPLESVTDMDYLAEVYRSGKMDIGTTNIYFKNTIIKQLEIPNRLSFCDSLYRRFIGQIKDSALLNEVGFSYCLLRLQKQKITYKELHYIDEAICFKSDIPSMNTLLKNAMPSILRKIENKQTRMDSIRSLQTQLKSILAKELLKTELINVLLDLAQESYQNKRFGEGEKLLGDFECICPIPVTNAELLHQIELAYYGIATAVYWGKNMDVVSNHEIIERGLKYVPESELIQSARYEKSTIKYAPPGQRFVNVEKAATKLKTGRNLRITSKIGKEKVYSF